MPRGFTRRAFIGTCAGIGAASVTFWLWRQRWQPESTPIVLPPLEPDDELPPEPTFVHPPVPNAEPTVRVRVYRARDEREVVLVGTDGQWLRVLQEPTAGPGTSMRGPLRVRLGPLGWSVTDSLGFSSGISGVEPITVTADAEANAEADEASRTSVFLGTNHYPGVLRFVTRTSIDPTAFDIINHVPLEAYLPGVVSRELYSHWHYETHAAQAIAARSFACAEHAYFLTRRHFDLTDNQSSQVYVGTTTHQMSIDAVADTRGRVLSYDGLIVPAYYSSCCGGTAAAAPDAIGSNPINAIPPLLGQSEPDICSAAPVCTWRTQRPIETTTRRVVAWAKMRGDKELAALEELFTIEPTARNDFGRPTHYALTDIYGATVELPAERLRSALNHFEPGLHAPARALRSSHFTATIEGEDFIFEGNGYGHGVGMCQHGAQIRARTGHDHIDILHWYYPGAEIVTAYE